MNADQKSDSKSPLGVGGGLGSLLVKQTMETKLRADFTSMLLGKKPGKNVVTGLAKPSGSIQVAKLADEGDLKIPFIGVKKIDSEGIQTERIKPRVLARR